MHVGSAKDQGGPRRPILGAGCRRGRNGRWGEGRSSSAGEPCGDTTAARDLATAAVVTGLSVPQPGTTCTNDINSLTADFGTQPHTLPHNLPPPHPRHHDRCGDRTERCERSVAGRLDARGRRGRRRSRFSSDRAARALNTTISLSRMLLRLLYATPAPVELDQWLRPKQGRAPARRTTKAYQRPSTT
jgi:hypothetical protein